MDQSHWEVGGDRWVQIYACRENGFGIALMCRLLYGSVFVSIPLNTDKARRRMALLQAIADNLNSKTDLGYPTRSLPVFRRPTILLSL